MIADDADRVNVTRLLADGNRMRFEGVISPLVTPFTADASAVNENGLRRLVDAQIGDGVGGLVTCGTTGEFSALSFGERVQVTQVVVEQVAGRVPVMVQSGSTSTSEAIELSQRAEAAGASGLLVPPPYYGSLTDDEIIDYYRAISETVELPICIYNIPSATGVGLSMDVFLTLAQIPSVSYIKDSSGDLEQQTSFLTEHLQDLTFVCGEELLVAPGLMLGLRAAVIGCANVIGPGLVQLFAAGQANDFDEVARINAALTPLMRFFVTNPYVAAVKAGMDIIGAGVGPVRKPFRPLPQAAHDRLQDLVRDVDSALVSSGAVALR